MLKSFSIVFKLFKNTFLLSGVLFFITLIVLLSTIGLKNAYELNLQKEFATKQPHIKVMFIDDSIKLEKNQIQEQIEFIRNKSHKINEVVPFVYGDKFYTSFGFKEGGNAFYNGNIKVIGVGLQELVYDFYSSSFMTRKPFEMLYTPLEFIYAFKTQKNIMVFNKSLFYSYFPVIESADDFVFKNEDATSKGKLASVFNDYDKQPIVYTSIEFANKMLGNDISKISGFFINASSLDKIETLTRELKNTLPKDKYSVISWLEERQKQFILFSIFESLSFIIVFVVLLLTILFILLLLYNSIVKRSYQLSVFYTIGFKLNKEIFIFIVAVMSVFSTLAILIVNKYIVYITNTLDIKLASSFMYDNLLYAYGVNTLFIFISYFLIKGAYGLKAKSVF